MQVGKIHNKGQAQIFRNKYLEYLTKTHPLVIWGMYLPVITLVPYYAHEKFGFGGWRIAVTYFAGMFFWTFFEYMMHRFVFHWAAESETGKKINYVLHGNHHEFPRDKQRLFMPPVPSLILSSIIFSLMFFVMGHNAFVFFPGFIFGYLLYGSTHYAIHAWNPPFKFMKPLWRNHHLHHYKSDEKGFGVSTSFWDHVFGTFFDLKNEKDDKEKVRSVMFEK